MTVHGGAGSPTLEEFFGGHPFARVVFEGVRELVAAFPDVTVAVSKSQVALRRSRGFAYFWLPGQYLAHPGAEVVLSIALGRQADSPRFKEVVHSSPRHWLHHLEVRQLSELDDEVASWLAEAASRAS